MEQLTSSYTAGLAITILISICIGHYGSYLLFGLLVAGILMYYGFFDKFNWYKNVKSKSTARLERMNSFILQIEQIVEGVLKTVTIGGKTIIKSGTINIEYHSSNGLTRMMTPFSTLMKTKMSNIEVSLIRDSDNDVCEETVNITQQPGIPYSFTAQQLNGKIIRAVNQTTGMVKEYDNIAPGYLTELHEMAE